MGFGKNARIAALAAILAAAGCGNGSDGSNFFGFGFSGGTITGPVGPQCADLGIVAGGPASAALNVFLGELSAFCDGEDCFAGYDGLFNVAAGFVNAFADGTIFFDVGGAEFCDEFDDIGLSDFDADDFDAFSEAVQGLVEEIECDDVGLPEGNLGDGTLVVDIRCVINVEGCAFTISGLLVSVNFDALAALDICENPTA